MCGVAWTQAASGSLLIASGLDAQALAQIPLLSFEMMERSPLRPGGGLGGPPVRAIQVWWEV